MAVLTFSALSDSVEIVSLRENNKWFALMDSEAQWFKQCGCLVYICDQSLGMISQEDIMIYVDNKKHSVIPSPD